ncbi:MAG: hypothetical protein Q9227_006524 [Pyrenula ochraceoflavens]
MCPRPVQEELERTQETSKNWYVNESYMHTMSSAHVTKAVTLEAIHGPGDKAYNLLDFSDPETVTTCRTMSDRSVGGFSQSILSQEPEDRVSRIPAHVLWHGNISTKLPERNPSVQRTGYAAFRNEDRGMSLVGRLFWNTEMYTYLAVRVKSDGRKYFVNLQTDSIVPSDIHQHRLYTRRHKGAKDPEDPGDWETVLIKWTDFVRTNHGTVVEPQSEIMRDKIRTVGIGLIDRVEGPFELAIRGFWATNGTVEKENRRKETESELQKAGQEPGRVKQALGYEPEKPKNEEIPF